MDGAPLVADINNMKILNTAVGILKAKFFGQPFYTRYHVTHRCNHRCRMCSLHELADEKKELRGAKVQKVAQKLHELGARHVVLTGGEAFLREDIADVVRTFSEMGFSVRIQTNGGPHVTRDLMAACARAGLRDVSVSIDTLNRKLQDDICQGRNVVDNALRTLRMARELLPDGLSQANVVASKYNFEELPNLVRFFHSLGVYTYITPVMIAAGAEKASDEEYLFRSGDTEFCIEGIAPAIRDRVIDELIMLRREGMGLTNSTRYLQDYRKYLETGKCDWKCEAGTLVVDVYPDGSVCVCKEKPPVGNILDEGFVKFYRSGAFREEACRTANECTGCFYGEYREPQYAVRDLSVFGEWVRGWFRTFRRGMKLGARPEPVAPLPQDPRDKTKRTPDDVVATGCDRCSAR